MSFAFRLLTVAVVATGFLNASHAAPITLPATDDTYIDAADATSAHNGSFITIDRAATSTRKVGLLQFNLDLVPGEITSVTLRLYRESGGLSTEGYIVQHPNAVKMDETTMSQNLFIFGPNGQSNSGSESDDYADWEGSATNLGSFSILSTDPAGYFESTTIDAGELTLLNQIRMATEADDRFLIIQLYPLSGGPVDFHSKDLDTEFAPELVVEYVPEPSAIFLIGLGTIVAGLMRWKRRK